MTSEVIVYQDAESARRDLARMEQSVMDVLPANVDAARFVRLATKAVIENPRLMECTRTSLWAAITEAASLGLEPTGMLGSAYLVPYQRKMLVPNERGAKVERKVMVAQLIPGYRGLIDLARRSGQIDAIEANIVRRRDVFDYEPTRQPNPVVHRPFIPDPTDEPEDRDRGPIIGAYMIATLVGGYRQAEWMTYDEIQAVRRRSRAADDGPWVTDEPEMCRKTVVRRGSKYLPLTTELRRALELDEEAERGAEPVSAATLPDATRMLVERARARRTALDGPQSEPVITPPDEGTSRSVSPSEPVPACPVVNDELGACTRDPGHTGAHRNEAGAWPQG